MPPITAKAFSEALPLTGVILTKADGDARGGAALSVRRHHRQTGQVHRYRQKTDALEPFTGSSRLPHPRHGGCALSSKEVERNVDKEKAAKLASKVQSGKRASIWKTSASSWPRCATWGMMGMLDKLPGMSGLPDNIKGSDG